MAETHANGLPPEVAALGQPLQTFAPAAGAQANPMNLVATVANTICALLLFGMALFFFRMYHKPFGVNPPPPGVSLGVALGCAVGGFAFLVGAVYYGGKSFGATRRTYLLFDGALVEVLPDRHRILPWERIGRFRRSHPWVNDYTFPVEGDTPVHFDETMTGHADLARAITKAALTQRVTAALPPGATLDSLRTSTAATFFLARRSSMWTGSFLYRVSAVGNCLLFLKVSEGAISDKPSKLGGGLVGGASFGMAYKNYLQLQATLQKLADADPRELLNVAGEYEGSFALAIANIRGGRVASSPSWQQLLGHQHGGRLELEHVTEGLLSFALESADDVPQAKAELGKLFPTTANVNLPA